MKRCHGCGKLGHNRATCTKKGLQKMLAKQHHVIKDTDGARRKAENLRRRIATLEARHADVLKDGESC